MAELQSQAFKYQQVVVTSIDEVKKEFQHYDHEKPHASFFPSSEVPQELVQKIEDKNEFQRILKIQDKGLDLI